jgi:large subunit ribosomal protein LP0
MSGEGQAKKMDYMNKLKSFMEEYPRIILVTCDNIGSKHMQKIRSSLRGRAVLLMGKNTLIRKAIKNAKDEHPEWQDLLNHIRGNVGLVFTKEDLGAIHPKLLESRVPALAKIGIVAPQDVVLPAQVTTLEPTKTNFFAALDIATKITRGCVEILNDVKLCVEGKKVGSSEAALLQMLDMKPFTYGLKLTTCYDEGLVFDAKLLGITKDHFTRLLVKVSEMLLHCLWPLDFQRCQHSHMLLLVVLEISSLYRSQRIMSLSRLKISRKPLRHLKQHQPLLFLSLGEVVWRQEEVPSFQPSSLQQQGLVLLEVPQRLS